MASYNFSNMIGLPPEPFKAFRSWATNLRTQIHNLSETIEVDLNNADRLRFAAAGTLTSAFAALWSGVTLPVGAMVIRNDTPVPNVFIWDGTNWLEYRRIVQAGADPTSGDNTFTVGTLWINSSSDFAFILTDVTSGTATWRLLSSSSLGYIQIENRQATNVVGGGAGTVTTSPYRLATLNTLQKNIGGFASLSTNQFTLAAGTYQIEASMPLYSASFVTTVTAGTTIGGNYPSRIRIRDTGGVTQIVGQTAYFTESITTTAGNLSAHTNGLVAFPTLADALVLASPTTFQLEYYAGASLDATRAQGFPANIGGDPEVYAQIKIWRI